MLKKRLWEVVATGALLVTLGAVGCGFLYIKHLNDGFEAALARNDSQAAFAFLRKGAMNIDAYPDYIGDRQPLFVAVRSSNPAFVELVLNRGADVNTKRKADGHTALMAATMAPAPRKTEIVRLMIERGADVNAKDANGYSAVFHAAHCEAPEPLLTLLRAGADINIQDNWGRTPLISVAKVGRVDMARVLLAHGADPSIRNRSGNSALDVAKRASTGVSSAKVAEMVRLLKRAGSK